MKILNRYNKSILFEDNSSTIKQTIENAINNDADLSDANLRNADLNDDKIY